MWSLALTLAVTTFAQPKLSQRFSVKVWSVKDGLPQHTVNAIAQTPDGYLWVATDGGLARFDGFVFRSFDKRDTPLLRSNRVRSLAVDKNGKLFIGMFENGIGYYHNGSFVHISDGAKLPPGSVSSIVVDENNVVWFVIIRQGLFYYDGKEGIKKFKMDDNKNEKINQVFHVNKNGIYIRFDNEIYLLKNNKLKKIYHDKNLINGAVYRESDGSIYITNNVEIVKFGAKIEKFKVLDTYYNLNKSNILELDSSNIVISSNSRFDIFNDNSKRIIDKTNLFPVNVTEINTTFVDVSGNRWFGSSTDGLIRLKPNPFQLYALVDQYAYDNSLSIYRSPSGYKWLSYMTDYLVIRDPSNRIIYQDKLFYQNNSSNVATYYSIIEHNGITYLGSNGKGIYSYKFSQKLQLIYFPDQKERWVKSLFKDLNQRIWVGTTNGLFELINNQLNWISSSYPELNIADVAYMASTKDGMLWVSTSDGIYSYNGKTWKHWDVAYRE